MTGRMRRSLENAVTRAAVAFSLTEDEIGLGLQAMLDDAVKRATGTDEADAKYTRSQFPAWVRDRPKRGEP